MEVISIADKRFIINKTDGIKINEKAMAILTLLANEDNLLNPVCISFSDDGILLVD